MKCSIVMYHYVRELSKSKFPHINALKFNDFKSQIKLFKEKYKILHYEDVLESIYGGKKLDKNSVFLTFDDGYLDHYNYVYPILKEEKINACFFPVASYLVEKKVLDVNKIHFILASINSLEILKKEIFDALDFFRLERKNIIENQILYEKLAIPDDYDNKDIIFFKRLLQYELPIEIRKIIIDDLFKKYVTVSESLFVEDLYMSIDHLKEMKLTGMTIGNHTYSHYWLSKLSKKEQIEEIENSLNFLSVNKLVKNNWSFSYPYGAYNKKTIEILKDLNCHLSFTSKSNRAILNFENRFSLDRLDTNEFLT